MRLRDFVTLLGTGVIWPYCAHAQVPQKVWRIGHVFPAAPSPVGHFADSFEHHMLSYFPSRTFTVARRFPEPKSVDEAVRELVPDSDLLVTWTTVGGIAAKNTRLRYPVCSSLWGRAGRHRIGSKP